MPLKGVEDDPKLFDLGESVIIKIRDVKRKNRLSSAKYRECIKGLPLGWAGHEKHKAKFDRRAISTG